MFELSGSSPLHYAAYEGHAEAVQILINYLADVNLKNYNGMLSLFLMFMPKTATYMLSGSSRISKIPAE